jgi:tetratricopeptide (TPR) repeat protein
MSRKYKKNKSNLSHTKTENSRAGDRSQAVTASSKSAFISSITFNRILLALNAALLLAFPLFAFTDMADAVVAVIGGLGAVMVFLFPEIRGLRSATWLKHRRVTVILTVAAIFIGGIDLACIVGKSNQPIVTEPQVAAKITSTATRVLRVPSRVPSVTPSPTPTLQPTSPPSITPTPHLAPSPTPTPTPQKILIGLANFDGPDQEKYRVTDTLYQNLTQHLSEYSDVEISRLDQSFKTSEDARAFGKEEKAAMVFWGWYGATSNLAPVSVHLEVLCLECPPGLGPEAQGQIRLRNVDELNSFALQTDLSVELSYLSHFIIGLVRYEAGKLDDAIASFTAALEQTESPIPALDKGRIYTQRAQIYSYLGKYDLALADFNKLIEIDPRNAWSYNSRGIFYANRKNDYDRAIEDFTRAIEMAPSDTLYRMNRGAVYSLKHDYDSAISDFTEILNVSNDPEAYNSRGNVYFDKQDYTSAINDYSEAIKLKNDNSVYYRNRANAYYAAGNDDATIADSTQAIELKGDAALAYNTRGNAYFRKGEYDLAITDFGQAIMLQDNDATFYYNRGVAFMKKELYDQATVDFTRAVELRPNEAEYYALRGVAKAFKHEYSEAITDFDQAINFMPNNPDYLHSRGDAYAALGNYEAAITDYTRAIILRPFDGDYHFDRGRAYMQLRRSAQAISDFRETLKLGGDPNNVSKANEFLRILGAD